jgi:hypothetical protein
MVSCTRLVVQSNACNFLCSSTLFAVLCPAQEFFAYMETSPFLVKGCKIYAYARPSGPLNREASLSCYTCCDTGPQFFRSLPKDRPIQSPITTHKGMWGIYSNPDPHGCLVTTWSVITWAEPNPIRCYLPQLIRVSEGGICSTQWVSIRTRAIVSYMIDKRWVVYLCPGKF